MTLLLALALAAPAVQQQPATEEGSFWNPVVDQTLEADAIDVGVWIGRLARLGLKLPVDIQGTVAGKLRVRVPLRKARDAKQWLVEGRLLSKALTIDGTVVRDLDVRLDLRGGVLKLTNLSFRPDGASPESTPIRGTATLPVEPRGPLSMRLTIDELDLASLRKTLQSRGVELKPEGRLSVTLEASVEADRLSDPAAWTARGPIRLRGVTAEGLPPVEANGQLSLANGVAGLDLSRASVPGASASGRLRVTLSGDLPVVADIRADRAADVILDVALPVQVDGPGRIEGRLTGTLSPPQFRFEGVARVVDGGPVTVTAGGLPLILEGGQSRLIYDGDSISLQGADLRAYGGTLTGEATFSLTKPPGDSSVRALARGVRAERFLASLDAPAVAAGSGDVDADLRVIGSQWADPRAYRGTATAASDRLSVSAPMAVTGHDLRPLDVDDLAVSLAADDDGVRVERLSLATLNGSIQADGRVPWDVLPPSATAADVAAVDATVPEAKPAVVRLAWNGLDVAAAATLANIADPARGAVSGNLAVSIPAGALKSPERWRGETRFAATGLSLASSPAVAANGSARLSDGMTSVDVAVDAFGGRTTLAGTVPLAMLRQQPAGRPADVRITWDDLQASDAARLAGLPGQWGGTSSGEVTATIPGDALRDPRRWTADGRFAVSSLSRNRVELADVTGTVRSGDGGVDATLRGQTLGGTLQARGLLRGDTLDGRLKLAAVDLARAAVAAGKAGLRVKGQLSADATGRLDLRGARPADAWVGEGTATIERLKLGEGDAAAAPLNVRFLATAEELWAELAGELAGGSLTATASMPRENGTRNAEDPPPKAAVLSGTARADGLTLAGLRRLAGLAGASGFDDWRGRVGGDVRFAIPVGDDGPLAAKLTARGPVRIRQLRYRGRTISTELNGVINLAEGVQRVDTITGSLARGQVSGSLALPAGGAAGPFAVSIRGLDPTAVAAFFGGELPVTGRLDVQLRGAAGDVVTATGAVNVSAGAIGLGRKAVRADGIRVPLALTYRPGRDTMDVRLRGGRVGVASGTLTGDASVTIRDLRTDPRVSLKSNLKVRRVDVAALTRQLGAGGAAGGRVSGRITLKAARLRKATDLTGDVNMTLSDATSQSSTTVTAIVPFVGGGFTTFQTGTFEARISDGVANIRRLSLDGATLDIYASGSVGLAGRVAGNLDLDVVAATGRPEQGVLRTALVSRAITVVAPPAGLLLSAAEAVRDRVVHLSVRGTLARPQVSVRPLETARDAGLRFLVRASVGG